MEGLRAGIGQGVAPDLSVLVPVLRDLGARPGRRHHCLRLRNSEKQASAKPT